MSNQESNSSNKNNRLENFDDEISLKDIIEFFRNSWKLIISMGLVGLVIGIFFLFFTQKQYEAVGQIQLSQLDTGKESFNPVGANIEDPVLLIARFKLPSTYSSAEIHACGLKNTDGASESLVDFVKITTLKGANSVVELKVRRVAPNLAKSCLESIFDRISQTQEAIKEPFLIEARTKLEISEKRLLSVKSILERADKSGVALSASYLSTRDEAKALQDQISNLEDFIASGEMRRAKLISPIYVSDRPVSPKKQLVIILSLLMGLLAGIIIALASWQKILNQKR